MIPRTAIIVLFVAAASAQAQAPRPEAQLVWQERHLLRGRHDRMTLLPGGAGGEGGGYRVVGSSGFRNPDDSFTEQWWILSLDAKGRKLELKEHVTEGNQAEIHAVLPLPQGRMLVIGGMLNWIAEVDADGTPRPSKRVRAGDFDTDVHAAVADKPDALLVAGSRTVKYLDKPPSLIDAWLARIGHDGAIVWQKSFDRAHNDMAASILPMPDGGCVMAVNSGKYSKFGTGPTALWLIRCDADGNKVADAVIEGAQIYGFGQKYLVPLAGPLAGGFVVSYTIGQLSGAMNFEWHLQAFDATLKPLWSRKLDVPGTIGSMLIVRHGAGEIAATGNATGAAPVVLFVDHLGELRRRLTLPFVGNFHATDILSEPDGVVVVGGFEDRERVRKGNTEQDVLLFKVR